MNNACPSDYFSFFSLCDRRNVAPEWPAQEKNHCERVRPSSTSIMPFSIAIAEKFHQDLTIEQICARGFPSATFRGCFEQT
jgi:hypothetical protein